MDDPGASPQPAEAAASPDLGCLGLGNVAQQVLAVMLDGRIRYGSLLARELGCAEMAVSRALRELQEGGFVDVDAGTRPAAVTLRPLGPLVGRLATAVRQESERRLAALSVLASQLDGVGREAPPGPHWVHPSGLRGLVQSSDARAAERSFACIVGPGCRYPPRTRLAGWRPPRCRYLLSRDAAVAPVAVRSAEVRQHPDLLPDLVLVDDKRMAVEAVIRGAGVWGWTSDERQVSLGVRLFEDLWEEGGPVLRWAANPFPDL